MSERDYSELDVSLLVLMLTDILSELQVRLGKMGGGQFCAHI